MFQGSRTTITGDRPRIPAESGLRRETEGTLIYEPVTRLTTEPRPIATMACNAGSEDDKRRPLASGRRTGTRRRGQGGIINPSNCHSRRHRVFFLAAFRLPPPRSGFLSLSFRSNHHRHHHHDEWGMGGREAVASARFDGRGAPGIYTRSFGNTFGRQM